jgi:hypothetical protein
VLSHFCSSFCKAVLRSSIGLLLYSALTVSPFPEHRVE